MFKNGIIETLKKFLKKFFIHRGNFVEFKICMCSLVLNFNILRGKAFYGVSDFSRENVMEYIHFLIIKSMFDMASR